MEGVSFVVPVHNGAGCIRETLDAIRAQDDGRPMEIIVVDDHSDDGSSEILKELAEQQPLKIVVAEERVPVFSFTFGIPPPEEIRESGAGSAGRRRRSPRQSPL